MRKITNRILDSLSDGYEKVNHAIFRPLSLAAFQQKEEQLFKKLEKHRMKKPIGFKTQAYLKKTKNYLIFPAVTGTYSLHFLNQSSPSLDLLKFAQHFNSSATPQSAAYWGVALITATWLGWAWSNNFKIATQLFNQKIPKEEWTDRAVLTERARKMVGNWIEQHGELGSKEKSALQNFSRKYQHALERLERYATQQSDPNPENHAIFQMYHNYLHEKFRISGDKLNAHWEELTQGPLAKKDRQELDDQTVVPVAKSPNIARRL